MCNLYYFSAKTFKEIEPTLKRCFNIDRYTPEIDNCIFYSKNPQIMINVTIPEEYFEEEGCFDESSYLLEHINEIIIPVGDTFNIENFIKFYKDYQLKVGTHFFEILFFMFLYYQNGKKGFSTDLETAEEDELQYSIEVRPELLELFIALEENKKNEPISIRLGSSKAIVLDKKVPWLREELVRYLHKYLGVASLKEAKREYLMNYAHKEGAPNNWKLNRYIWGVYNLLEETGTIKAKTERTVSRKQAKFIEDYLFAIGLINLDSKIDEHNIRSRLNSLMKNYDSIEELTENLDYKSSPNNEDGTRLF